MGQMNQFALQTTERALYNSIVVGIPFARHTLSDAELHQFVLILPRSVLYAPVTVKNEVVLRAFSA